MKVAARQLSPALVPLSHRSKIPQIQNSAPTIPGSLRPPPTDGPGFLVGRAALASIVSAASSSAYLSRSRSLRQGHPLCALFWLRCSWPARHLASPNSPACSGLRCVSACPVRPVVLFSAALWAGRWVTFLLCFIIVTSPFWAPRYGSVPFSFPI